MRKIYSLIAMFIMAIAANAQVITFGEADLADKGTLDGKSFSNGGLVLTITDTDASKLAIDANKANFGTLESYQSYTHRLKTGGKSSSKNALKLTVPSAGTLKISARTATKDSEREMVLTQNGKELLNQPLLDSQAATSESLTVFPVYSCEVEAGDIDITYPTNGINFYAFELVAGGAESKEYTLSASIAPDFADYVVDQAYFPAAEIAAQLGLADAAALYDLINTNTAVYLELADGSRTNEGFTGDTNETWMNANAEIAAYGAEGTCWFAGFAAVNAEDGTPSVNVWVDQMPDYFKTVYTESNLTATFYIVNGDKAVKFIFNLHVDAAEVPEDIAEPVGTLSALTIVKEYAGTLEFNEGDSYEGKTVSIDMADLAAALGVSEKAINDNIEKIFMTQGVVTDEAGSVSFSDSLSVSRFGTDGWFGRYTSFDESTGNEVAIVQNAPHAWGEGCTFYVQNPTLADGQFTITTGSFPNALKEDSKDYAEFYIVAGNKAAKVTYTVSVKAKEAVDFSQMTLVGEQEIDANPLEAANAYTSVNAQVDMSDVIAKLGGSASDWIPYFYGDEEFATVVEPTATDWWLGEAGISQTWGDNACCQLKLDLETGVATLLQMPRYSEITEAQTFPMYFIVANGANYYRIKINFTLKPVGQIESDTECVATEVVTKQIVPNSDSYAVDGRYQLDLSYIESVIGTKDFTVYGDLWNAETEKFDFTKDYSCYDTTNGGWGFWYGTTTHENEEHQVVVFDEKWGAASTNSFGFQLFPDASIGFFQFPGQRSVGDAYTANIYLMNEANGKYIKFIVNVVYVEEITADAEVVGTEPIYVQATEDIVDADGYYNVVPDFTKAYEALGITAADLESASIIAPKSQYVYGEYEVDEQILYGSNGYVSLDEAEASFAAFLSLDDKPTVKIDPIDVNLEASEETEVVVRIGLEYDKKRYMYEIHLQNEAAYTDIAGVKTAAKAEAIYNVAGAKVNGIKKGLNIVKMADGSVKKVFVK